jgi:hypothetical protein
MVLLLNITGCTNKDIEKDINTSSKTDISITREKFDKIEEMNDRLQGNYTGIFKINNLEKGKYKVVISMEEYNYGKIKKSRDLITSIVEIKDYKDNLYVGINKNENNLTFDISHINGDKSNSSTYNNMSVGEDKAGYSWSMLENLNNEVHKVKLGKEISIASFSVGNNNATHGITVGEGARKPSEYNFDGEANSRDIVIYLKIYLLNLFGGVIIG